MSEATTQVATLTKALTTRGTRARAGFVLPFVLVTLLLVAALAGSTSFASWRAVRSARLGFNGERALQGTDEALVAVLASWNATAYAAQPIGARWALTALTTDLGHVSVTLARPAPLALVMRAGMQSLVAGSPDTAGRSITRYVALVPPEYPVRGAVTAFGGLALQGAALADGLDTRSGSDGCGTGRDTTSVSGVHGVTVALGATAVAYGRPPVVSGVAATATIAVDRIAFDSAWTASLARISRTDAVTPSSALSAAPPWSARRIVSADSLASATRTITLGGASTHTGLLLVDGDLVLSGALVVEGLLVVRGGIDASAGTLVVDGAVLARDDYAGGVTLGDATRIRYSQCSVGRALATVARPGNAPFATWIER